MRFEDKTVFITGGGSGLGRATAHRVASEGGTVVLADIDADSAAEVADELEDEHGATADSHELDVRNAEAFQAVVDAAAEAHGLDAIHNNAGISHERGPIEEIPLQERDRVIDVNAKGVWNGCLAAIPHFKEQDDGAIVNTASLAGVTGEPQLSAYSLTKGGVVNFTHSIAAELGPHGIRANAVCPAVTDTPMARSGRDPDDPEWEEIKSRMAEQYPLRRLGRPEDIAAGVAFLASDDAAWMTGQTLVIDGGYTVRL